MIYLALFLIVVGVALFVAAPLFETATAGGPGDADSERSRLEHERALAVQALRDLEFDHEMRKLSEQDWSELRQTLEARALRAMAALEKLDQAAADRGLRARKRPVRIADAPTGGRPRFCPECGQPLTAGANFCGQCGGALKFPENQQDARSHG